MDERTLNDLLECSVCLERLDTTSKVLPCQHTFCRKCLEVIVSSHTELRCPECRVLVEIKIDELPPNVLLMRILEGMKNATHNQINSTISIRNTPTVTNKTGFNQQTNNSVIITNHTNRASDEQNIIRQHSFTAKQFSNSSVPHAKALYDFTSKKSGDISFKKGDNILLRKRLDLNWFIGELNGREGSFPVNHVQIIVPLPPPQCKALYDFRMGPNEEEGCLTFKKGAIINVFRRVDHNWAEGRIGDCIGIFPIAFVEMNALAKQIMDTSAKYFHYAASTRTVPPTPIDQKAASDSSSTVTTSPNTSTSSNTTSTSSTAPSSPITHLIPQATKPREQKEKRHSLTIMANTSASLQQSNRHSAEILSVADAESNNVSSTAPPDATRKFSSKQNDISYANQTSTKITTHNLTPNLPTTYVALYPYKPQKPDELELKKGSVYFVTERCQDGWYKGANRAQKSGVFPGNYVATLRNNKGETHQVSNSKRQVQGVRLPSNQQQSQMNYANISVPPPELPPRSIAVSGPVWAKPLGHHVEAFFNRKISTQTQNKNDTTSSKNALYSETQTSCITPTCNKDKKESSSSAVSLMKRLTNIKRSKSPTPNSSTVYSMDNPVFEDTSATPCPSSSTKRNVQLSHPVHVRSGSCPSQLLQSLPIEINSTADASNPYMFGSQRVKGHKERPILHGIRNNFETNRVRGAVDNSGVVGNLHTQTASAKTTTNPTMSSYHRKSQSLDATTIAFQLGHNTSKINKAYTHKERFRCIVSYPPNSEFELELHVGDIVYVHKKRDNGWYKGTHSRTGKMGLFPASFVEPDI